MLHNITIIPYPISYRYATHWNDEAFYQVSTGVKVGGVTQYEQVGVSVRNFIATHVSITMSIITTTITTTTTTTLHYVCALLYALCTLSSTLLLQYTFGLFIPLLALKLFQVRLYACMLVCIGMLYSCDVLHIMYHINL